MEKTGRSGDTIGLRKQQRGTELFPSSGSLHTRARIGEVTQRGTEGREGGDCGTQRRWRQLFLHTWTGTKSQQPRHPKASLSGAAEQPLVSSHTGAVLNDNIFSVLTVEAYLGTDNSELYVWLLREAVRTPDIRLMLPARL